MQQALDTFERYELVRELGRGGVAVVYLAYQRGLRRHVAVKKLDALHATEPAATERFLREARLEGSLTHPNIVTVHDFFEADAIPFIVMEFLEGGSMRSLTTELSLAQVAGVLEGVLAGLAGAHRAGIIHRDLKPENVLFTGDGRVKIADFGIAKAFTRAASGEYRTATGMTVGTPAYMAPEQAMGKDVSPRTDLYSCGVLAYEMLTQRRPFGEQGDTPGALLLRQVADPLPPPTSVRPDLHPDVAAWLERMLMKAPEDRFGSADDAWEAFEDTAIRVVGPRWRKEAALCLREASSSHPGASAAADRQRKPQETADEQESAGYETFRWRPFRRPAPPGGRPLAADILAPPPEPSHPQILISADFEPARAADGEFVVEEGTTALTAPPGRPPPTAPPPNPGKLSRRRRRQGAIYAVVTLVILGAFVVARTRHQAPRSSQTAPSGLVTRLSMPVGDAPGAVAIGAGACWIANYGDGTVTRIDLQRGSAVGRPIVVGEGPIDISASAGAAWVANRLSGSLIRIDARSGLVSRPIQVGSTPIATAVGASRIWILDADGTVRRIDPRTMRLDGDPWTVRGHPSSIAVGGGSVWITDYWANTLKRFHPRTGRIHETISVGRQPRVVEVSDSLVWVANFDDRTVLRIDSRNGERQQDRIAVQGHPVALAASSSGVWVSSTERPDRTGDGVVQHIGIQRGARAVQPTVLPSAFGVGVDGSRLWVSDWQNDVVRQLE